ncbi:MAG: ATPase, T2SS/T4P/T4SS family, partial [Gammaproteobacteria bacterium]
MQNLRLTANELPGLAGYLYRDGHISLSDAQSVLATTQASAPLHLLSTNMITNAFLLDYCKQHFTLSFYNLNLLDTAQLQTSLIKPELIYRYRVLSLGIYDQLLHLGITDPTDHAAISAISFDTGLRIKPFLIDALLLETIIDTHFRKNILYQQLERSLSKMTTIEEPTLIANNDDEEPVINLVNSLVQDAIEKNSSDIHLEPFEHFCRIRFRCDGLL